MKVNGKIKDFMEKGNSIFVMVHFIRGLLLTGKHQERVAIYITMVVFTKVELKTMMRMDLVLIMIRSKVITIKVIGHMTYLQGQGSRNFQMDPITKVNF